MAKLPRTALNETPSQTGTVPLVIPQETPTPKVMAREREKQGRGSHGLHSAKNAIEKDGIDNKRKGVGDDKVNAESSDPESQRRQRAQKHGGTELNAGLSGGRPTTGEPMPGVAAHGVKQHHGDDGKEEAQEPEQRCACRGSGDRGSRRRAAGAPSESGPEHDHNRAWRPRISFPISGMCRSI